MPATFTIPAPLVQSLADYLSSRPYREVAAMIDALVRAATPTPAPAPPPDPEP